MNALFFIFFSLFLIVVQTVILPVSNIFVQCFDLMIINILLLSLIINHVGVVIAIIVLGIIMDSLSGVPFGYHLFSYLWIYILVTLFRQLFFQKSVAFLMVISIVSVLIQQLILLFSIFIKTSDTQGFQFDISLFVPQLLWAFIVIPPSIWALDGLYKRWIKMSSVIIQKWEKTREH